MMNGNQMASEVKAAVEAVPNFPGPGLSANFLRDDVLIAFCTAVVQHIQNNADVKSGIISLGPDPQGGTVTSTSQTHTQGIQ